MENIGKAIGLLAQIIGYAGLAGIAIYAAMHSFGRAQTANWKDIAESRAAKIKDLNEEIISLKLEISELGHETENEGSVARSGNEPSEQGVVI